MWKNKNISTKYEEKNEFLDEEKERYNDQLDKQPEEIFMTECNKFTK